MRKVQVGDNEWVIVRNRDVLGKKEYASVTTPGYWWEEDGPFTNIQDFCIGTKEQIDRLWRILNA